MSSQPAGAAPAPVARCAGGDDAGEVRRVLAEAFPDNPKARADVMDWQYWRNPYGPPRTWLLEEDGAVIAVYTGIPVRIAVQGRPTTAALGIDAAVAPAHQGRRLFTPLSAALYEDLGRQGWVYTMAYPSLASRNGIARAGWVEVARLRVNVLPTDDGWLAERFHLPRPAAATLRKTAFRTGAGREGSQVDGPPAGIDELWADVAAPNGIVRDRTWWDWRYAGNPDPAAYRFLEVRRAGRLVGAAVVTVKAAFGGTFGYVLEFLAQDRAAARSLAAVLVRTCDDVHGLAMITRAGSDPDRRARAAGFRRLPQRLEPHPQWFGAVPNVAGAPRPDTLDWTVAWGDLDHL